MDRSDYRRLLLNIQIAVNAILENKIRAFLTSMGIIFGVASVITMLAIGKGAETTLLEQMKLLGANNIIIAPNVEQEEGKVSEDIVSDSNKQHYSPGLTLSDAESIGKTIPYVEFTSPEIILETTIIYSGKKRSGKLIGIDNNFWKTKSNPISMGKIFSDNHLDNSAPVCVIGNGIRTRFFAGESPLGKKIKCGKLWLTIIGVLEQQDITSENIKSLGIRDYNMDVYTPVKTVLIRYKNRGMVTLQDIQELNRMDMFDEGAEEETVEKDFNYHQIDRIVVKVNDNRYMSHISEIIKRMLERRHYNVIDYEISIPEQLIQQEQRTKRIFNIVLGAIASISLIVGGIGVMNIMLASVMDRFKEIGIRQSIGATRKDVTLQFMSEAITITLTGGVIGIFLGYVFTLGIEKSTGITGVISLNSVLLSFLVSVSVGLIFGIYPAKKAAKQDPVVLLRHD
ncbi:MAG: FtsX-like permease family protein [Candidatus Marinimicrobia bacterium]|jgi:putative ABC transport system permease protein|nr:FtsX-like permease family protein [Candidatus Neomarinimicrobiota bacterium]MBT3633173.1 FtsX-like permease family protein [Candidatus Neomarinimicrobiota bacterium]MBT3682226.1 FtsX-like permease family protein [Candidatus Neomarinimicrobiota bacterium]MBT3758773.1 FtsX-like permease family protein [Candidatus Neomarinimicrobiota bacterium]MBT3895353.1 FtsX-like permease family protein [Candidatus Neomarinimicrobiota bacterium]